MQDSIRAEASATDKALLLYDELIAQLLRQLRDDPNPALFKEVRETLKWLDIKANPKAHAGTMELTAESAHIPFPRQRD